MTRVRLNSREFKKRRSVLGILMTRRVMKLHALTHFFSSLVQLEIRSIFRLSMLCLNLKDTHASNGKKELSPDQYTSQSRQLK